MTPRTLTIALIASVTLNVFILSAVGGAAVMHHRAKDERGRHVKMGNPLVRIAERLPDDVRARYIARMRQEGGAVKPRLKAARAARTEAAEALGREPYDPAAVSAALGRARSEEAASRASLENAIIDFARELKPEERAIIADALRKPSGPLGRGGRRDGSRGGPKYGDDNPGRDKPEG